MGNFASGIDHKLHPDVVPPPDQVSKFDPLYGFPNGRKEKVMIATQEELMSAKIPLDKRDYCAHVLIEYQQCRRKNFPLLYKCHGARHHYLQCEFNEYIDRMKDYEREKRLLAREKRKGRLNVDGA